jgi:hypothetical protein
MTTGRNPLDRSTWIADDRQLVPADRILRLRLREAHGLAKHLEKLQGNARSFAQLAERRAGESGESVERAGVEVGEGQRSFPHRGGHPVERHAGQLEAPHPAHPPHVTGREPFVRRSQDAEVDQPIDVVEVDPSPAGHLFT